MKKAVHLKLLTDICLQLLVLHDDWRVAQMDSQQSCRLLYRLYQGLDLNRTLEKSSEVEMEQTFVSPDEFREVSDVLILVDGKHCQIKVL